MIETYGTALELQGVRYDERCERCRRESTVDNDTGLCERCGKRSS